MADLDVNKKIVILSSEDATVQSLTKILASFGYKKIRAMSNGIEAIEEIVSDPCDFIICDMSIKFISGWALIKEIKNSDKIPNIPTMLIGSVEAPAGQEELNQYGIVKYLKAPFRDSDVKFMINSTLLLFSTSGTIESKYTNAKQALLEEKTDNAIELYSELQSLTKKSTRSSVGLAEAYIQNEDMDNADKTLKNIADGDALSGSALMLKMRIFLQGNNVNDACKLMRKLLTVDMAKVPFYFSKSLELFLEFREFPVCEEICVLAAERAFDMPDFEIGRAKIQFLKSNFEGTLAILDGAEAKYGQTNELLNMRGICLKKNGDFRKAIEAYEQALVLSPMDAKIFYNLASCAIAMKDYAQAAKYLQSCIEIAPQLTKAKDKLEEITRFLEKKGGAAPTL